MRTNEVQTTYELLSVNAEERTGVFRMRNEEPKRGKWIKINVSISGLLAHKILHSDTRDLYHGDSFVKTQFTSTIDSREVAENPFQLTKFIPSSKSDMPMNYQLKYVTEKYGKTQEIKDAMGNRMTKIRFRKQNVYNLKRYVEVVVDTMMKDVVDKVGVTIVEP